MKLYVLITGALALLAGCTKTSPDLALVTLRAQHAVWTAHDGEAGAAGKPVNLSRISSDAKGRFQVVLHDEAQRGHKPACSYIVTGMAAGDSVTLDPLLERVCQTDRKKVAGYVVPRKKSDNVSACTGENQGRKSCYESVDYSEKSLSLKIQENTEGGA
jgi:hypothetical protein